MDIFKNVQKWKSKILFIKKFLKIYRHKMKNPKNEWEHYGKNRFLSKFQLNQIIIFTELKKYPIMDKNG